MKGGSSKKRGLFFCRSLTEDLSSSKVSEEQVPLLSGAIAWRMCRERLGRLIQSEGSLREWVTKVRNRQLGLSQPDPLGEMKDLLPELQIELSGVGVTLGEFGICGRRVAIVFNSDTGEPAQLTTLSFGDLYQVVEDSGNDRMIKIICLASGEEGYLERDNHITITPGEFRLLHNSKRDVRLTFLTKLLSERHKQPQPGFEQSISIKDLNKVKDTSRSMSQAFSGALILNPKGTNGQLKPLVEPKRLAS